MAQTSKIKIDLFPTEPIRFWWPVDIPTHDRKGLCISFHFLHRTKKQIAELQAARYERARVRFEQLQEQGKAARVKADAERAEIEARRKAAEEAGEPVPEEAVQFPEAPDFVAQAHEEIANGVEALMELADDWNVDGYEFNADNLAQLCTLHGASAESINIAYGEALSKGRLGNSKR